MCVSLWVWVWVWVGVSCGCMFVWVISSWSLFSLCLSRLLHTHRGSHHQESVVKLQRKHPRLIDDVDRTLAEMRDEHRTSGPPSHRPCTPRSNLETLSFSFVSLLLSAFRCSVGIVRLTLISLLVHLLFISLWREGRSLLSSASALFPPYQPSFLAVPMCACPSAPHARRRQQRAGSARLGIAE